MQKAKKIWSKEIPPIGTYWIKYRSKHGVRKTIANVSHVKNVTLVSAHTNIFWIKKGSELFCDGQVDKSIRFGPKVVFP